MDLRAGLPYLVQSEIAHIAAGKSYRGQRWTAFHGAIGFQRQSCLPRTAAIPVNALVAESAPAVFIRAEVSNVISDYHQQVTLCALAVKPGQQRHHFKELVGLKENF